jgi:hypothetical protein
MVKQALKEMRLSTFNARAETVATSQYSAMPSRAIDA